MSTLIFGCGYLGSRVAMRWRDAGHKVTVVTRSRERAEQFRYAAYAALVADVTRPGTLLELPVADTVLYAVGYDRSSTGGPSIEEVYAGGLRHVLDALSAATNRIIYISTTGVYGPANGGWVDETTPPDPGREGGRAALAAEQVLAAHPLGARGIILRLAGIYGPGRVPFLDKLRAGEPIPAPANGYLNLIHVDDAVEVVLAAERLAKATPGPYLYCVSDGHPIERRDYYREIARQIGAPPPRFVAPDPDSPRTLRAQNCRRMRNERMHTDLRVTLKFPDYRAGIADLL